MISYQTKKIKIKNELINSLSNYEFEPLQLNQLNQINSYTFPRFTYLSFGSTRGVNGQLTAKFGGSGKEQSSGKQDPATLFVKSEKRRRKLIFDYVPWSLLHR